MAKASKKNLNLGLNTLEFASVHWFHYRNQRVDTFRNPLSDLNFKVEKEGDNEKAIGMTADGLVSKLSGGWNASQGITTVRTLEDDAAAFVMPDDTVVTISVEEVIERANAERQAMIDAWDASDDTKAVANVARRVWFPDGKPVEIVAIANDTYRRSVAVMGVLARRKAGDGISYTIPVNVVHFASELDRLLSHERENDKDGGRSKNSALDHLKFAANIRRNGGKEAMLTAAGINRGNAQKLWAIVGIAWKYPELNLIQRCFMQGPADGEPLSYVPGGYVPFSKLDKEQCRRMLKGYGFLDTNQTTPMQITAEYIENKYLASIITGNDRGPTAYNGKQINEVLGGHPVKLLQSIAKAIAVSDGNYFASLGDDMAKKLNEALDNIGCPYFTLPTK
jgi:hypothetical protein